MCIWCEEEGGACIVWAPDTPVNKGKGPDRLSLDEDQGRQKCWGWGCGKGRAGRCRRVGLGVS